MSTTVTLLKASAVTQIQTDLAATVAASAASASLSAANAAASANTALNAQATEYLGTIAGGAVPATATTKGQYYVISADGFSQTQAWVIGDKAIYNGTSGSWSRITGFLTGATAADLAALAASLEPQGLAFDGTAGATVNIPAVGTGDFELMVAVKLNALPAGGGINRPLFYGVNGVYLFVEAGLGANSNRWSVAKAGSAVHIYAPAVADIGVVQFIGYSRAAGVGSLSINNIVVATGADANDYSGSLTVLGGDVYGFLGTISALRFSNRALTAAERDALIARGLVTLPEQRGGSMTALNTSTFANSGVVPWSTFSGASATGFTASMTTFSNARANMAGSTFNAKLGQQFRVEYDLVLNSGSAPSFYMGIENVVQATGQAQMTAGTGRSVVLTCVMPSTGVYLQAGVTAAANTNFVLSNVKLIPLGTVYELGDASQGHGPVIPDTSGNGNDTTLPADGVNGGVARISPRLGQQEIGPFDIAGTGNAIVGGVDVARIPAGYSVAGVRTLVAAGSTGNYRLGTASAGQQIAPDTAVTAGVNQFYSLVNPQPIFTSATRLWHGRSGTLAAGSKLWLGIAPTV